MTSIRVAGSGDIELAVRLDGDPAAAPMVLLHALGETSRSWARLTPQLATRYRVAALDLRGHGDSDWPGHYTPTAMADDVIAAMNALGFASVTLMGHSLGGAVAILVAERLGDRVERLVIEDAIPPYPRGIREVPTKPDEQLPFDWAMLAQMYGQIADPSMSQWPALATITAPTLVLAGGPSSHIPSRRIAEMSRLIPDCTVVTIDAGHYVHDHAHEEFAEALWDWLGGDAPAAASRPPAE